MNREEKEQFIEDYLDIAFNVRSLLEDQEKFEQKVRSFIHPDFQFNWEFLPKSLIASDGMIFWVTSEYKPCKGLILSLSCLKLRNYIRT